MKAGVILTSDFVVGNKKSFENYIRYIDRKEAKQKDFPDEFEPIIDEKFEKYLDYMNRETAKQNNTQDKSTGLFNEKSDLLTKEERREVYKSFRTAQKNNSVLWRDVYSFDTRWLEQNDLLVYRKLNEEKIKDAVRNSMHTFIKEENLDKDNIIWAGEIHYNTDNYHVHVAISEKENSREMITYKRKDENNNFIEVTEPKGKRKNKTNSKMKSSFIHHLVERNKSLEQLNQLRNTLNKSIHIDESTLEQRKRLNKIISLLPEKENEWSYNHHRMKHLKKDIDEYTETFLNQHCSKEFDEYRRVLLREEQFYKEVYGLKSDYQTYSKNKYDELKSRMGNELLRIIKNNKSYVEEKLGVELNRPPSISNKKDKEILQNTFLNHVNENSRYRSSNKPIFRIVRYRDTEFKIKLGSPIIRKPRLVKQHEFRRIQNLFNNRRRQKEVEAEHQNLEERIRRINEQEQEL